MLRVIKHTATTNILDDLDEKKSSNEKKKEEDEPKTGNIFRFGNIAMLPKKTVYPLYHSVLFDPACNITLTFDKDRFIEEIEPTKAND